MFLATLEALLVSNVIRFQSQICSVIRMVMIVRNEGYADYFYSEGKPIE